MRKRKIILLILALVLVLFSTFTYIAYKKLASFSFKQDQNGGVPILILGKGGLGHAAPDLTDTILLANISFKNQSISLISLPRDIWVESTRAKLNSSYYWGKEKSGSGFDLADQTVFEITGVKPVYNLVVDFSLFKDLIDVIGGITVDVENSFIDSKYPIAGKENDLCGGDKTYACRYETVKFDKGFTYMDGQTALKFVRSRNSDSSEGNDLAREKRQQKVIAAIKNKILSRDVLFRFDILSNLYKVVLSHVETDIDLNAAAGLVRDSYKFKDNVHFINFPENLIKASQNNKKYDFQYVFIPVDKDWSKLKEFISSNL